MMKLQQVLQHITSLVALISILTYCILVATGNYKKWSLPILIGVSLCKLLSVRRSHRSSLRRQDAAGSSSSSSVVVNTFRQRLFQANNNFHSSSSPSCCCCTLLRSIYHTLHHRISNDNNLYILSTLIILLPCLTFYICRVIRHLTTPFDHDNNSSSNYNHKELANDFGKLSAASLSFLLLPLSKYSKLLLLLGSGNNEVHLVRMHIYAGYLALLGGILHGLYYIWIWIEVDGYTSLDDVFPLLLSSVSSGADSNNNSDREMHEGHDDHNTSSDYESSSSSCFVKDYNKQCHTKFVNLSGIINGISFLLLGFTSLWYIRRHYYIIFYYVHIVLSSSMLLFTLLLHYNKMIWYIGPSILCYIGCNVPVYIEGMYKSLVGGGGVCVSKVCCIPESRGCVELTIVRNDNDDGGVVGGDDSDDDDAMIGKYVRLTVPEISSKSHPFTAFCDPNHHHHHQQQQLKILFRPIGKFTTQLSKRLELLVTSPELTASEYTLHSSSRTDAAPAATTTRLPPKMLINGVSTSSNLVGQSMKHDHMIIVAGGVGIVPYINLISSLYKNGMKNGKSGGAGGGQQRRRSYELDDDHDDGSMEYFDNNGEDEAVEEEQSQNIQKARRVDIHWISRDEGLIRHIVDNYLSFYRRDGNNSNTLSITISIHHTNESSALSISNINEDTTSATTETTLTQYMAPSESTTSLASPTSLYEGNKRSLLHNVLPTLVFASIVFGGLWIINYCYENIQDKHVMETRPISVIGIIIWSVAVSIASLALVKMTETFSRVVAYTKLDNGVGVEEMDNGNGEIECGEMPRDATTDESVSSSDDNMSIDHDDGEAQREGGVGLKNGECREHQLAVPIAHLQGRPDLRAMFKSAIERAQDEEETNLGVFTCGPSMLTDAVSKAIKNSQEQRGCGHNEPRVYIYQEMFEL